MGSFCDGSNWLGRCFHGGWPLKWLCEMAICSCCSMSVSLSQIDHRPLPCVYSMLVMCFCHQVFRAWMEILASLVKEDVLGCQVTRVRRAYGWLDRLDLKDVPAVRVYLAGQAVEVMSLSFSTDDDDDNDVDSDNETVVITDQKKRCTKSKLWLLDYPRINLENVSVFELQWICWILKLQYFIDWGISTA